MDERRRLPRKYLIIYSRVFDLKLGKLLGYLVDLNTLGCMIISDDPLELGAVMALRFDLPDAEKFTTGNLNVVARIAWCKPDLNPAFQNVGFEFLDITPQQKAAIETMMDVYEFRRDGVPAYPATPDHRKKGETG